MPTWASTFEYVPLSINCVYWCALLSWLIYIFLFFILIYWTVALLWKIPIPPKWLCLLGSCFLVKDSNNPKRLCLFVCCSLVKDSNNPKRLCLFVCCSLVKYSNNPKRLCLFGSCSLVKDSNTIKTTLPIWQLLSCERLKYSKNDSAYLAVALLWKTQIPKKWLSLLNREQRAINVNRMSGKITSLVSS